MNSQTPVECSQQTRRLLWNTQVEMTIQDAAPPSTLFRSVFFLHWIGANYFTLTQETSWLANFKQQSVYVEELFLFQFQYFIYSNRPGKIPRNRSSIIWFHSRRCCIQGTLVFPHNNSLTLTDILLRLEGSLNRLWRQYNQRKNGQIAIKIRNTQLVFSTYLVVYGAKKVDPFPWDRQKSVQQDDGVGVKNGPVFNNPPQENTSVRANTSVSSKILDDLWRWLGSFSHNSPPPSSR